jgi:AcrR family transcriptional regulator
MAKKISKGGRRAGAPGISRAKRVGSDRTASDKSRSKSGPRGEESRDAGIKSLEPQQARSRESLRKLLKAAAEVLGQHGVEGTTIPRIAAHAGLTPGAIYRRFNDKDALLETVIMGILERQDERLRTGLTPDMAGQIPLPVFAEQIVHTLLVSYRANAGLLRAIRQFVQGRVGTEFWKKACRLELRSYERMVEQFLAHAKDIQHSDPRRAVSLGMLMVISTLHELVLDTPDMKVWKGLLPQDDQALKRELTRAFLGYLGGP